MAFVCFRHQFLLVDVENWLFHWFFATEARVHPGGAPALVGRGGCHLVAKSRTATGFSTGYRVPGGCWKKKSEKKQVGSKKWDNIYIYICQNIGTVNSFWCDFMYCNFHRAVKSDMSSVQERGWKVSLCQTLQTGASRLVWVELRTYGETARFLNSAF